jgi:hypothetical protein
LRNIGKKVICFDLQRDLARPGGGDNPKTGNYLERFGILNYRWRGSQPDVRQRFKIPDFPPRRLRQYTTFRMETTDPCFQFSNFLLIPESVDFFAIEWQT